MNGTKKICAALSMGAMLMVGTGCATVPESPDLAGLHYAVGELEGNKFHKCVQPGTNGDAVVNDEIYWLPTNLRTWTIDDMPDPADPTGVRRVIAPGADSMDVTIVSAAPQADQPSGIQVKVSTKSSFYLNTFCDANGGTLRLFWEKVGRSKKADTPEGWRDMLNATLVPVIKAIIKDVVREYAADPLIANKDGIQAEVQRKVGEKLAVEVNRLSGGNFFCGTTFNRTRAECPPMDLLIIGVEYADPGIQAARNKKAEAVELAAAKLATAQGEAAALIAEATGKKNAAAELAGLYNSPGWVALQKQIEASRALVEACKAAKECKLIVGPDGNLIMA